jgi:hypothetical protein
MSMVGSHVTKNVDLSRVDSHVTKNVDESMASNYVSKNVDVHTSRMIDNVDDVSNVNLHVAKIVDVPKPVANVMVNHNAEFMSIVRHLKRPPTDIQRFDGNVLNFRRFVRQFNAMIIANCNYPDERMHYLEQFKTGECPNILTFCFYET